MSLSVLLRALSWPGRYCLIVCAAALIPMMPNHAPHHHNVPKSSHEPAPGQNTARGGASRSQSLARCKISLSDEGKAPNKAPKGAPKTGIIRYQHSRVLITPESSKQMTETLETLMLRTARVLDLLSIRYTIGHATLLGWVRNRTMLAHDDDIDLRIHPADWSKLAVLAKHATMTYDPVSIWPGTVDAGRYGTCLEVHKVEVDGQLVDIAPLEFDSRLGMVGTNQDHLDLQVRVKGVGFTGRNLGEISSDVHLDVVSGLCVQPHTESWIWKFRHLFLPCFWKSYAHAFEGKLLQSTLNGIPVSVTPHYETVLSRQYGATWRTPIDTHNADDPDEYVQA